MLTWEEFEKSCQLCMKCELHKTRKNVVIGRGNIKAPIMLIGEGPGRQEDEQGIPFVGQAGQLLDQLLAAQGFEPGDYYIANIVKCRPPQNRDPYENEALSCLPFLRYQVKSINPKIIVCMGRIALRFIVDKELTLSKVRGMWINKEGFFDIIPVYHPAALLRDASKKEVLWQDFKKVKKSLEEIRNMTI